MPIVKLISSGIGLAFEANAAREAHKADKAARSGENGSFSDTSNSNQLDEQFTEVSDNHARELVDSGHAVPVDSKKQTLPDEVYDESPPTYAEAEEMDEADWQLDEAVGDTIRSPSPDQHPHGGMPSGEEAKKHYIDQIVQGFLSSYPPPFERNVTGNLPCPVIIPQRRPHNKRRGFVQAYAPVLAQCGIDQDAFMQFHKVMFKASQASPVFDVINLAAAIAGLVPSLAAMVTSMVVQAATKIATEVQSRQRSNSFLNQINDQFFRPRGLFCMVMKYDPNQKDSHERINFSSTISKTLTTSDSSTKEQMKKFKVASAKTYGEIEMPEAAPLIFPGLDSVADVDEKGKPKGGFKKTREFLANYYDKRAQAEYTTQHQGSTLASALPQERKFASRFGDPNHPVNSGSLVSLVTGGKINPRGGGLEGGLGGGRQGLGFGEGRGGNYRDRYENDCEDNYGRGYGGNHGRRNGRDPYGGQRSHRVGSQRRGDGPLSIKYVKRMLKPNMLYLMIVNMPTDKEMEEARAILTASQK